MQQTRLSLLTSRTLLDNGGASFLEDKDYSEALDATTESMSYQFLIDSFERKLSHLKKREYYADKLENMPQVASISEYNQMNLAILQMDEHDLLTKNLDYLVKTRDESMTKFN